MRITRTQLRKIIKEEIQKKTQLRKIRKIIKEEIRNTMINEGALDGLMAKAADIGNKVVANVINMAVDIALESEEYELMFDDIILKLARAAGIEVTDELKRTAQDLLKNRKSQGDHSRKDWSKFDYEDAKEVSKYSKKPDEDDTPSSNPYYI